MEYTLWCDESISKGKYFSNFYGGALVSSAHIVEIQTGIQEKKSDLHFFGEVKWSKVSDAYLPKYTELIKYFFTHIAAGKVKIRIMFTQNYHVPVGLTKEQKDNEFFILYYQFIKHCFGFTVIEHEPWSNLKIFFDQFPDKKEKCDNFVNFIHNLRYFLKPKNLTIRKNDIAQVTSHDHDVLQCLDIILGSIAWRLNNGHKYIEPGKKRRGKKTIAKEKLYKTIASLIDELMPTQFNVGISTGMHEGELSAWLMPYRQWKFIPKNKRLDSSKTK